MSSIAGAPVVLASSDRRAVRRIARRIGESCAPGFPPLEGERGSAIPAC